MLTTPVRKPTWFDVYPEFDTRIAYECVGEVDEVRTRIASIRDTITNLDTMTHTSGAGPWLETYTRNCQHIFNWLSEATTTLSRLSGTMDNTIADKYSDNYSDNVQEQIDSGSYPND